MYLKARQTDVIRTKVGEMSEQTRRDCFHSRLHTSGMSWAELFERADAFETTVDEIRGLLETRRQETDE